MASTNELECLKDLDFWTFYSSLCMINKICPLRSVIRHLKGTEFCCPVEAVRSEHWKFLLEALSVNNNLTKVHLRSEVKSKKDYVGPLILKQRKRKSEKGFPTPYGLQSRNLSEICRSLSSCLKLSYSLNVLKLDHLPLKLEDVELLSVGLLKSQLIELSFSGCLLTNESVQVICDSLKASYVEWLDFSSCSISTDGVNHIADLIKCHADRRRNEAWPDTLRYRFPVLDNLKGLSRISLNDNAGIDDAAAKVLADCLIDDLWIKALDLQKTHITDEGASSLLQVLTYNCVLEVLDLQWNFISDDIFQRIMVQLDLNNTGKILKYEKLPSNVDDGLKVKKIPRRNPTLKIKIIKKIPARLRSIKSNSTKRSSAEVLSQSTCDKSTITDGHLYLDHDIECENGHSHMTQKYLACLAHAKKQQQHLVKKLKILTLENHFLRDALQKQTIPEGMILIDNDTYNSVKETFEKLESFLAAMKENGWASLKETDANAIRNFIFSDARVAGSESPVREEEPPEPERCRSIASQTCLIGVRTAPRSDHEVCEGVRHSSHLPDDTKSSEGDVKPLDRTLVRKIFECMQRIHSSPNHGGKPPELPKKFVVRSKPSAPDLHWSKPKDSDLHRTPLHLKKTVECQLQRNRNVYVPCHGTDLLESNDKLKLVDNSKKGRMNKNSPDSSKEPSKKELKMKDSAIATVTFDNSMLTSQFENMSLCKDSMSDGDRNPQSVSISGEVPLTSTAGISRQVSSDESRTEAQSDIRSYLESVESVDSTDPKPTSDSPIKDENVAAIMWLLNESSSSDSDLGRAEGDGPAEGKLASESELPSLSDITTVSSRSIHSLAYELTESDKV